MLAAGYVSTQVGGFGFLLGNLLEKRDLLAGLGPFTALAATGGIAVVFVAQMERPAKGLVVLSVMCWCTYASYLFVMGSRFPLIAFTLAPIVARSLQGRTPTKALGLVLALLLPFSVWYSVSVRKGQVLDESTEGATNSLARVIDPFVFGGLDVINTFGAVVASSPKTIGFDTQTVIANLLTMVPRSFWPGKPPGLSTQFSAEYFATAWTGGSGVPPSILAEITHLYGVVGACIAALLIGWALVSANETLRASQSLYARLFLPMFTVDCIVLAKSGTDAFAQQVSLHLVAVALFILFLKLTSTRVESIRNEPSSQQDTNSPHRRRPPVRPLDADSKDGSNHRSRVPRNCSAYSDTPTRRANRHR